MRSRHAQLSGSGLQAAKNKVRGFILLEAEHCRSSATCVWGGVPSSQGRTLTYLLTYSSRLPEHRLCREAGWRMSAVAPTHTHVCMHGAHIKP